MSKTYQEQQYKIDDPILNYNPFQEYPQIQMKEEDQRILQHPLCLNTKYQQSLNTPLSRLSQQTYHSQIKYSTTIRSKKQISRYLTEKNNPNIKQKIPETNQQLKAQVKYLTQNLTDLTCYVNVLEKRNQQIAVALQKQKLKSSHLEHALSILRRGDQHLDRKINQQSQLYCQLKQQFENSKDKNMSLMQRLENSLAQNSYIKELILIANSNYEVLQKKYFNIVQRNKKIEQENLTKQKELTYNMHQMKNLLTDLINTPTGQNILTHNLSFGEQDQNAKKIMYSTNNKSQKKPAEQIYRKMFIKTLKGKK